MHGYSKLRPDKEEEDKGQVNDHNQEWDEEKCFTKFNTVSHQL